MKAEQATPGTHGAKRHRPAHPTPLAHFFACLGLATLLAACEPPPPAVETPVKAVKTLVLERQAGDRIRVFSGRVSASDTAVLSFPVGGTVAKIPVNAGDKVKRGQPLATIDSRNLALEVEGAKADLLKAQAALSDHSSTLRRNQELQQKGFIGRAVVEQSEAAVAAARSDVAFRQSQLARSRLKLEDTTMTAPFAGIIGERFVQPNEEIGAGTKIMTLLGEDRLEIEISVPEIAIAQVAPGMAAKVRFGALPGQTFAGQVSEIGRVAGAGNVYPIKIALSDPPEVLRAGMTAEVGLVTPGLEGESEGLLVPVAAFRPGDAPQQGSVFLFDDGVARRVPVSVLSVRDNDAVITGVEPGSRVIIAGVAFLTDGQRVKLMTPASR